MLSIIRNIHSIDKNKWASLLNDAQNKSFFQTPECYSLYEAMPFLEPFVVAAEEDGILLGLMMGYIQKDGGVLKSYFSRRAIVNGGPLLIKRQMTESSQKEILSALLSETRKLLKGKAIYLEIRNFNDYSDCKPVYGRCGFKYNAHYNFHIDTSSVDVMEGNLGKSRKRDIRYTLREGAEIIDIASLPSSEAKLREFYTLLSDLYRAKVKTPLFPFEFFSYLSDKEYAKILLVEHQEKVVGGTVNVCLSGYAVYEWFACGYDGRIKNVYPSTLATYAGIRYAAENGFLRFDMMGAGKPGEDYGVRDFKAKFGGNMVEHGRFIHVFNPILFSVGKFAVRIMKGKLFKK